MPKSILELLKILELKRDCDANDTAHDRSGRVRVESQSRAPMILCPILIHSRCSGLLRSGGCDGFCSSLKLSAPPVVVLVRLGMCGACSSKRSFAYWTWCKNSPLGGL